MWSSGDYKRGRKEVVDIVVALKREKHRARSVRVIDVKSDLSGIWASNIWKNVSYLKKDLGKGVNPLIKKS